MNLIPWCNDITGILPNTKLMAYTVLSYTLIRLVLMIRFNCKATPNDDPNFSCHINLYNFLTNHMGSISCQITPLAINRLGNGHTNTHT